MFTQYKVTPMAASEMAQETATALSKNVPGVNPAEYAARTIAGRLRSNPHTYLAYGPYWWTVKAALKAHGFDLGSNTDDAMAKEYGGDMPMYAALVVAEKFRDLYHQQWFVGTSSFVLDAEGKDVYVLFDEDMEARALSTHNIERVLADMNPLELSESEASTLLDSVEPFVVQFEHEAQLWSAHIYAGHEEAAHQTLQQLERTGRLAHMLDYGKHAGAMVLDSTGTGTDFYVDYQSRTIAQAV